MENRSLSLPDSEKQYQHPPPVSVPTQPAAISFLRVAQYTLTSLSLVFVACAIDRNILVPGVTSEEIVNCSATVIAAAAIPSHLSRSYRKTTIIVFDAIVAALLFAPFMYGAVQAGQNKGACLGPSKMGMWNNTRGCTRMKVAAAFTAVNFLSFAASAVVVMMA
ncbi:hypothetical protein LZ32DRAFT_663757 [Colletotrichum eremochloae]|nr:hypothetical protein LZ32DRAFT_663757 [Colletotrichum eremochloae]